MASQSSVAEAGERSGSGPANSTSQQDSLEMENLDSKAATTATEQGQGQGQGLLNDVSIPHTSPMASEFPSSTGIPEIPGESKESTEPVEQPQAINATPDADADAEIEAEAVASPIIAADAGPVLVITLLLPSGARHPYKIDEKYLTKRNVNVPDMTENGGKDPFSISVYTLKELILREWREEWEAAPSSPSSIRLIYFGRLLDDKTALKGKNDLAPFAILSTNNNVYRL